MLDRIKKDGFRVTLVQPTIGESFTAGKSLMLKIRIFPTPSWELNAQAELFNRASEFTDEGGSKY